MQKLLSLKSDDFLTGIAQYRDSRYGFFNSANGVNPFGLAATPSPVGTIAFSNAPSDISASAIVDNIVNMAVDGSDGYATSLAKLYKITGLSTTTTPSLLRSVANLAYGLDVFQTAHASGAKYLYYWQNTQIGRYDLASTYTDNWASITAAYQSAKHPTHRIDDRIFYAGNNVVSMIYDDATNADPAHSEAVFKIRKDFQIDCLTSDDTYLIVFASRNNSSLAETHVFFWDWKNGLPSWTKEYVIQDSYVASCKTIKGVTYGLGTRGLFALTFGNAPELVRTDVVAQSNIPTYLGAWNDALTIATSSGIKTYGKAKPQLKTALFSPFGSTSAVVFADFSKSIVYGFYSTGSTLCRQQHNTLGTASAQGFTSSLLKLGKRFKIGRVDMYTHTNMASGDTFDLQLNDSYAGASGYTSFPTIGFSTAGAVRYIKCIPTADLITDTLELYFTNLSGTFRIEQIDIYGEAVTD